MRRVLVRIHLWLGLLAGLHVLVVCLTGAALVYRIDLQRALSPELFTPRTGGPPADPATVMESVGRAYPIHRLAGVDAPTTLRPTYLAYVTSGRELLTVLIDPASAEVLGALPEQTLIRTLQDLHYNLLGGRAGRIVNGIGAFVLLLLGGTGLTLWWPAARGWRRAFVANLRGDGRHAASELHRVLGVWSVAFIAMWASTGVALVFPAAFRAVVSRVATVTIAQSPQSIEPIDAPGGPPPSWRDLIERARSTAPGLNVARVVLPADDRAPFLVQFSPQSPTPAGAALPAVYLDQHTGELLADTGGPRTWGDAVMAAMVPLHVGAIGGPLGRGVWFLFALAPPALFFTGGLVWWRRVVRDGRRR